MRSLYESAEFTQNEFFPSVMAKKMKIKHENIQGLIVLSTEVNLVVFQVLIHKISVPYSSLIWNVLITKPRDL